MKVYKENDSFPKDRKIVLTIGSFDGLHLGHRKILERVKSIAKSIGGESAVITFDPHPRHVLPQTEEALKLLNDPDEKSQLMKKQGINHLVFTPFTKEFSQQSPQEYIQSFLINNFKPSVIVIGYDHRFGIDRKGNIDTLKEYSNKDASLEIIEIPKEDIEEITVSSTKIRNYLNVGNIEKANKMLGYPYSLSGKIVTGNNIGSKIGFPTANLSLIYPHKLVPGIGVYAVKVDYLENEYEGMLYIGARPTLGGALKTSIEVNIFNFNKNIYDQSIRVHFYKKIREEVHFQTMDHLQNQLLKDKENVLKYFS